MQTIANPVARMRPLPATQPTSGLLQGKSASSLAPHDGGSRQKRVKGVSDQVDDSEIDFPVRTQPRHLGNEVVGREVEILRSDKRW